MDDLGVEAQRQKLLREELHRDAATAGCGARYAAQKLRGQRQRDQGRAGNAQQHVRDGLEPADGSNYRSKTDIGTGIDDRQGAVEPRRSASSASRDDVAVRCGSDHFRGAQVAARSVMSQRNACARPPSSRIAATTLSAASRLMSYTATLAPSRAKRRKVATPTPPPPPVTTAVLLSTNRLQSFELTIRLSPQSTAYLLSCLLRN